MKGAISNGPMANRLGPCESTADTSSITRMNGRVFHSLLRMCEPALLFTVALYCGDYFMVVVSCRKADTTAYK